MRTFEISESFQATLPNSSRGSRKESKQKEKSDELIQVENELKTISSECTTLEKVLFTFNAQIIEKLKCAAKTTSNELRC